MTSSCSLNNGKVVCVDGVAGNCADADADDILDRCTGIPNEFEDIDINTPRVMFEVLLNSDDALIVQ